MTTLAELKALSPAYQSMSDMEFASKVYRTHYADKMKFPEFAQAVGFKPYPDDDPAADFSGPEKFAAGVGKSVVDTGRGLGQLLGVVDEGDIAAARERDAPLMNTGAGLAGNIAGQVGQMAVPVGGSAKAASLLGKAAPYVANAARAGAFSAAQGTVGDESRLGNAAEGAALSIAGQGLLSGVGRAASGLSDKLTPAVRRSVDVLQKAGVPLHAAQVSSSKALKTISSALSPIPFSGAGSAAAKQNEAWSKALSRTFGHEMPRLSDEGMAAARKKIGAGYESIFSKKPIVIDDISLSKMAALEKSMATKLPAAEREVFRANIDDILANAENGVLPGGVYQSLRGELVGDGSKLGAALKGLRSVLDDTANRSVGKADAAKLATLNQQWANMRTVEQALKQVGGAAEEVRPASLWPLIRKGSTQEMRDLARAGQVVLKDPIPDSGTAARAAVYGTLLGGGAVGANSDNELVSAGGRAMLGAATIGRALNSPTLARYLANGAAPAVQKGVGALASPLPFLIPAANQRR